MTPLVEPDASLSPDPFPASVSPSVSRVRHE